MLDAVGDQVEQHLADVAPVGDDAGHSADESRVEPGARFFRQRLQRGADRLDLGIEIQIDDEGQAALRVRHVAQNAIDDIEAVPRAVEDVADIAAVALVRPRAEPLLGDHFRERDDGGERRADLVREMLGPIEA